MKKRTFIFSLFFIIIACFASIKVDVNAYVFSDNQEGGYEVVERSEYNQIGRYSSHVREQGNTIKGSTVSAQQVNVLTQTQTADSKVVTWAIGGKTDFTRKTIIDIAKDYEANHPDYIVVGGINADQYATGFGENLGSSGTDYYYPQPYYPMICDGEAWFSLGPLANGAQNVAGFLQDGSKDSIVSGSAKFNGGDILFNGYTLTILDESDNVISTFSIEKYNEAPLANETTIYTSFYQKEGVSRIFPSMDISGSLYVVEDAIRAYPTNSVTYSSYKGQNGQNAFFGKGVVSKVTDNYTISKGQFALSTNNEEVKNALSVGTKIVVQNKYVGALGNVESAVGYHTIQRMDGLDLPSTATYNTQQYPRSIFGRKADGTICLVTIDGRQASSGMSGTSHDETNAILKHYGLVEAYQMDGGGSATSMIRNVDGEFVITNSPSDGSTRAVFSALLFVERKAPEIEVEVSSTDKSASFSLELIENYSKEIAKYILVFNNKEYEFVNGSCVVDGLRKGRSYDYAIYAEDSGGCRSSASARGTITTTKTTPVIDKCIFKDNKYVLSYSDPDSTITEIYLEASGTRYEVIDNQITVEGYLENSVLVYKYNASNEEITVRVTNPDFKAVWMISDLLKFNDNLIDDILK